MASSNEDIIDFIYRSSGLGNRSESFSNLALGINHRGIGNAVPTNTDNHGLTFFTRPNLNLTYDNLAMDRRLVPLASKDTSSWQRAIRCWLDPDNAINLSGGNGGSVLVDPLMPFITLLTNTLSDLSGWPDPYMGIYQTKEGKMHEVMTMADGPAWEYGSYPLSATFRNIAGDPITLLANAWRIYMAQVNSGVMVPYPDSILRNEADYNTRIIHFVLDPSRRYITKSFSTGAAILTGVPLGAAGNHSADTPYNMANASLGLQFQCDGCEINDPITFEDFNRLMEMFNPTMAAAAKAGKASGLNVGSGYVRVVDFKELLMINNAGYPWVDIETNELQWWLPTDDYQNLTTNPLTGKTGAAVSNLFSL